MQYIDTYEFTRLGQNLDGHAPLAGFARLLADLPAQLVGAEVSWSLRGERNLAGQRFLLLHVRAVPQLACQRCLEPLEWPLESDTRLLLVNSEADLETESSEDDDTDRVVGARRFDVWALVEDELILSLPYVPKHDVCPSWAVPSPLGDEPLTGDTEAVRPSPFAALGKLKKD